MVLEIIQKYLYENVIRYLNLLNDVTIWDTLILALSEFQKTIWMKGGPRKTIQYIMWENNSSYKIVNCDELM
jgi:hypothetical protein